MAFRLREDAERWFSEIDGRGPIKTKFDLFYFCLMAGFAAGRYEDISQDHIYTREIVDYFIEPYKKSKNLIIGLLVITELKKRGVSMSEKNSVREVLVKLVTSSSSTGLTESGLRAINSYASGGFEVISESRDVKPYMPAEWLRDISRIMQEAFEEAGNT